MIRTTDIYSVIPTVRVMRDDGRGFRLINERDFDPARHRVAEDGRRDDDSPKDKDKDHPKRKRGRPRKVTTLTE